MQPMSNKKLFNDIVQTILLMIIGKYLLLLCLKSDHVMFVFDNQ